MSPRSEPGAGHHQAADPGAAAVLAVLVDRGQTLATAESLTGGLIGELLTSVPGASACYLGGAISYATRLKHTLVGVPTATLDALGPVAPQTAREMAIGVAGRCAADWGLAVTGVAGPEPQDGHPVGQVYVGLARPATGWAVVRELRLTGDRAAIRWQTAVTALALLTDAVRNSGPPAGVDSSVARSGVVDGGGPPEVSTVSACDRRVR